jgi:hypothetical protein
MAEMDFPAAPTVGQKYTAPSGVVYEFDGYGWVVGFYDATTQQLQSVGDVIDQIRILLQDTDNSSGQYRYSTDSIILSLNQGMVDLYRMRPDIFLSLKFIIPIYSSAQLDAVIGIEMQYISPLVFYAVGLVQARDDEQSQDARAASFLQTFKGAVLTVS